MTVFGTGWQRLIGHDWATHLLGSAIFHQRIGHAYLFTGARQIGKMTLARTFAQALNCTAEPGGRPCGECRSCSLIAVDRHPDVRVIFPEVSERGIHSIKIEQIRRLQQDLSLSTYEARYKVAILKNFDTANPNAANAFLKTLEEPPTNVILLLTAIDSESLLPTITSRCRTINLRSIPLTLIEETLMTRWRLKPEEANLLAHLADGRLGWAIEAHQERGRLQERSSHLDLLYTAIQGNIVTRFSLAETIARKAETLPTVLQSWLSWWRDLAVLAFDRRAQDRITNIDQLPKLHEYAGAWSRDGILTGLSQTELAMRQLKQNGNARLVLENVFLRYPTPDRLTGSET